MTPELLRVRDLEVSFSTDNGVARVLDKIDLTIGRGEVVGLVGESGCGKTTLARAILGVLPTPVAQVGGGTIVFDGENLLEKDAAHMNESVRGRTVTFIPQDPYDSFNPLFKVGSQIRDLMKWNRRHVPTRADGDGCLLLQHPIHEPASAPTANASSIC